MGPLMSYYLGKNEVFAIFSANNPKVMRFMPPIVITRDEADKLLSAVDRSMTSVMRSSRIITRAIKLPLVGKVLGVQEMQVFLILFTKTVAKIIPKKRGSQAL
jgi:hypothetical protein